MRKKEVRKNFRQIVFERARHHCQGPTCPSSKNTNILLEAHHITDRHLMPNGGYVWQNGIALCSYCHEKAEQFHSTGTSYPNYSPDDLYKIIKSSYKLALTESQNDHSR